MAQVQKWGNSLAIRLPKRLAEQLSLTRGSRVTFSVDGERLILEREADPAITLEALLLRCTPENRHEPVDWGAPVGREIV